MQWDITASWAVVNQNDCIVLQEQWAEHDTSENDQAKLTRNPEKSTSYSDLFYICFEHFLFITAPRFLFYTFASVEPCLQYKRCKILKNTVTHSSITISALIALFCCCLFSALNFCDVTWHSSCFFATNEYLVMVWCFIYADVYMTFYFHKKMVLFVL